MLKINYINLTIQNIDYYIRGEQLLQEQFPIQSEANVIVLFCLFY